MHSVHPKMSDRRTSFMLDSSTELASETSPSILPTAEGPASWTTSQGDDIEGGLEGMEDEGDMQDSDDLDTTDNFDQELDESRDHDQEEEDDLETKMDELYHQLQVETKAKVYRSNGVGSQGNNKLRNQVEQELQATMARIAEINLQLDYYKQRAFDPPSFDIVGSLRSLLDSPSIRLEQLSNLANILKQNQQVHPGYPIQELASINAHITEHLPYYVLHRTLIHLRSLMADHRVESERIEALKLVRCFVTTKEGMQHLSDGIVRAVIAIAEQSDEKLRNACLETLGEMVMSDPKPVARCGGFRPILVALSENLQDLSDGLLKVFLYMLESPDTRIYLRQGLDSEMVMSVFTDIYSQGPSYMERVKASGRIVTSMIRSWAGLFDLCANDKRAIRSLVQSIKLPIQENRKVLLNMFYEIFRIRIPIWLKEFLDGKHVKPTQDDLDSYWESNLQPLGLVDHHQSIVLTVFIDAGLIEMLTALIVENSGNIKCEDLEAKKILRKAALLIPELMQLAYKILPPDKSIHIQTLPSLFQVATNFDDPVLRHIAASAFRFIDALSRTSRGIAAEKMDDGRGRKNIDRIKLRIGYQLDDANFRSMLNETQVLATKDASKWQLDLILEVIQGPMLNPRRLDEATRNTKFIKRLLAFYRPLDHTNQSQPDFEDLQKYTKIGCALFETLANSTEGAKYLAQNKILRLIADGLAQLDPMQGHPGSEDIFSREKMETTISSGYFEMLGTLCKSRSGSWDGHPRVILSKIMTSGYKHIRLYATQHLGTVIKNDKNEFTDWGIRLLCTQLCDPSLEVCYMAVKVLDEACAQRKNLDLLIRLRPNLDHLGEAGNPLLLRFLSTSKGFRYLNDMSYIEGQMDDWFMFANRQYMIQTEVKLARAMEIQRFNPFSEDGRFENEAELQITHAKQVITPHFYGELTRTDEGCELLRKRGHFAVYARFIREHCAEFKDSTIISELKSILWAVGNIGSTTRGLPFLEEEDLIKYIVGMAERSKVLSLKGTCFYVLGLMCKTTQGIEILEDYGWQGIMHRDRMPRGLCLPKDLDRFLEVPRWDHYREVVPKVLIPLAIEGDVVEKEILRCTGELGNDILTGGASKKLAKIKTEHPTYFGSLPLYMAVIELLGHYHFRLPVRRFILGLFDMKFEGSMWERLDSLGSAPTTGKVIMPKMASSWTETMAIPRDSLDVVGRSSFDGATGTTGANGTIPRPRIASDALQEPHRPSSAYPLAATEEATMDIRPNDELPAVDTQIASTRHLNRNGNDLGVMDAISLSQPPIPPPRPPPNAYEILYTNKPYHRSFAREAGLAPLPPRVKIQLDEPVMDEDLMPMEAWP
ncbi:hypothetical protein BX616_010197 [Lobosporangium transversale]|nr:hypothetical protein BX616_010197 [Lobosporangium transversale]